MALATARLRAEATRAKALDPEEEHVRGLKAARCRFSGVFPSVASITPLERR
jgi:hypothetical protein